MTFTTSRSELEGALLPLGYEFFEQEGDEENLSLAISHPDHEGIRIEIALRLQDGSIAGLERVVFDGPEWDFFTSSPFVYTDEFNELPEVQQKKLLSLLFGDFIAYEHFTELTELIAAIQEKVQTQPIP